jgi:hypothetical protein
MSDLRKLEQQLDEARRAFAIAHYSADSKVDALYEEYLRLQSEYNFASTAEMRESSEQSVGDLPVADRFAKDVIVEVRDQEWNVEGRVFRPASSRDNRSKQHYC